MSVETVVLTGASGFIGGRVLERLVEEATEVRCLSREPKNRLANLKGAAVAFQADLSDRESLTPAFEGADVAFYLVHSLGEDGHLLEAELQAARNFADAASQAGVSRIVYLGALAQGPADDRSPHVESRNAVGQALRDSGVPVTEFRASVVIGNGSLPFEVVRALVERLPLMITPRWVNMRLQPIGVEDTVSYLLEGMKQDGADNRIYEIGGRDVVTYEELMKTYEHVRGLRRVYVSVPVVTPRLSSHWLRLVTPAHFRTARRIVESAGHDSVVRDSRALVDFSVRPRSVRESIEAAVLEELDHLELIDHAQSPVPAAGSVEVGRFGNTYFERRRMSVEASTDCCFRTVSRVGGKNGWYWGDWLWKFRGWIDEMVGGPGLRSDLTTGDTPVAGAILDFWTVERFIEGERMTLRADMKLPGSAWLDFSVRKQGDGTEIEQTVVFACRGLFGQIYWKVVQPIHAMVFRGMLTKMASASAKEQIRRDQMSSPTSGSATTSMSSACVTRSL